MAELAAVGAAASIIQLVQVTYKVGKRIKEYETLGKELPGCLRQIAIELPVLELTLIPIKSALASRDDDEEAQRVLDPAIQSCLKAMEGLYDLLDKVQSTPGDSRRKQTEKALKSLYYDSDITKQMQRVRECARSVALASLLLPSFKETLTYKVREWITQCSAPDSETFHRTVNELRIPGTGRWFLDEGQYHSWKTSPNSFIWLHGFAGCGKSVLSSGIIEDIRSECNADLTKNFAYFYFSFNEYDLQNSEAMLRSLVTQLSRRPIKIDSDLQEIYEASAAGQRPPQPLALRHLLRILIGQYTATYLVVDALDECSDRAHLMKVIRDIASWGLSNCHLIVTSRDERDIREPLEPLLGDFNAILLQNDSVDQDIQAYVRHQLAEEPKLKKWNKDAQLREEIESRLMLKAKGMFRWAQCQLDSIKDCRNRSQLRKSLETLPKTLDETYDRILSSIAESDRCYAVRVLRWLAFSHRPLSVQEMTEIVAIDSDDDFAFDEDEVLEDPLDVLSICSSLITLQPVTIHATTATESSGQMGHSLLLAHYSVKEYLLSTRIQSSTVPMFGLEAQSSHTFITRACIAYLSRRPQITHAEQASTPGLRLTAYCAFNWLAHAGEIELEKRTSDLIVRFLEDAGSYRNWLSLTVPEFVRDRSQNSRDVPDPLYYPSLFGLTPVVRELLKQGKRTRWTGGNYESPLMAAACEGHVDVVELLLKAGASVNQAGKHGRTALTIAATKGFLPTVRLLMQAGAEKGVEKALKSALRDHNVELTEALLVGSRPVSQLRFGDGSTNCATALHVALGKGGNTKFLTLLLDRGARDVINWKDSAYYTPLHMAVERHMHEILELLLSNGADANAQNDYGRTPVHLAVQKPAQNHSEDTISQTIRILLRHGADPSVPDDMGITPLHYAARFLSLLTLRTLVQGGADVSARDRFGDTPLHSIASIKSFPAPIAEMGYLLDSGADVNARNEDGRTPLHSCVGNIHDCQEYLLLLKARGADLRTVDKRGITLLKTARRCCNEEVQGLLEREVNINVVERDRHRDDDDTGMLDA